MASLYPHVTFVEVPVTNHNANLHQGLEVPSLPYGHIYYPEAGLVEEMKISKKYFHGLVKMVRWYDEGSCGIDEFVPESEDTTKKTNRNDDNLHQQSAPTPCHVISTSCAIEIEKRN